MTCEAVEALQAKIEANVVAIDQFADSLKTAIRDLSRENRQEANAQKRAEKERLDKENAAMKEQMLQEEATAKKQIALAKMSQHFIFDWSAAGHPTIHTYDSDAALNDAWSKAASENPFMLRNSDIMKLAFDKEKPGAKHLAKFAEEFPKSDIAKQKDRCIAPMKASHGAADMQSVWDHLVPPSQQVAQGLPSLVDIIKTPKFTGSLETVLEQSFDGTGKGFLGSIRIQASGETQLIAASAKDLQAYLSAEKAKDKQTDMSEEEFVAVMMHLAEDTNIAATAKQFKEKGLKIYHGTLVGTPQNPTALVMPPGWVLCYRNIESKAWGIRKAVLQKGANSVTNLNVLKHLDQKAQDFIDLLQISK